MNCLEVTAYAREGRAGLRVGVDGTDLRSIVTDVERPAAEADGQPNLAGTYEDLVGLVFPDGLFFGSPQDPDLQVSRDHVALMGCSCGTVGCWPFAVRIDASETHVRWAGFRQPHRQHWRYDALGELHFDRAQYVAEVARARERFAALVDPETLADQAARLRADLDVRLLDIDAIFIAADRAAALPHVEVPPADASLTVHEYIALRRDAESAIARALGLTLRQAWAVAGCDVHGLSTVDRERLVSLRQRLAQTRALEDPAIFAAYGVIVREQRVVTAAVPRSTLDRRLDP